MAMKSLSHGDKIKINPFELDYIVLEGFNQPIGTADADPEATVQ